MLQQTQVARIIPKFETFIEYFPDEDALAQASLADVLRLWQGLGYNRRARFLHEAVRIIVNEYQGVFPSDEAGLISLPGVGKNTAGAVRAYSFNQPSIFIETNVRTVYFHHFFQNQENISDKELYEMVARTMDVEHPREWYWALMDYGSWLKAQGISNISRSTHYTKQSPLRGSLRETRGVILRQLVGSEAVLIEDLRTQIAMDDRFDTALAGLIRDKLLTQNDDQIALFQDIPRKV
jgi:A/G-specific adenine glycosylase